MLKSLLFGLASISIAGNASSQEIFSWYFLNRTNSVERVSYVSEITSNEPFFKENNNNNYFVEAYLDVLTDKVAGSSVIASREIQKEDNFNKILYHSFVTTCVHEYETVARAKRFADYVKDNVAVKKSLTKKKNPPERTLKLVLRPVIKGVDFSKLGVELLLQDAHKNSLGSLRAYSDHTELKMSLSKYFDRRNLEEIEEGKSKPAVSFNIRQNYEGSTSAFISYEVPLD